MRRWWKRNRSNPHLAIRGRTDGRNAVARSGRPTRRPGDAATARADRGRNIRGRAHDPEKWEPVSRLREARSGGRSKVGKDHAQTEQTLMRIVGGKLRSRPLAGPKSDAVRPTSDRLREALLDRKSTRLN